MSLEPRFPPLKDAEMSEAQRRLAAEIASGPRGNVRGPFVPLLRSPEIAGAIQSAGKYLRYVGPLPRHLMEMTVLLAARAFRSTYEWQAHAPLAIEGGLPEAVVAAIGRDERPASMSPDVEDAYDFITTLLREHAVDDALYARVHDRLGDQQTIDLVMTCGYYVMNALMLNVARVPMPEGKTAPFPPAFAKP